MASLASGGAETRISQVIGGVHNLPTPPIVFTQIQKVLNNPNTSAYEIASILQEDPAMSAKVLKLTNSAYYGLSRAIESVKQAVVIVGLDAVKNLVLSASMFDAFSKDQIDTEFQDYFWRHSLATGFAARLIALSDIGHQTFDAETGFSGGLLHDIGKMVISIYMPEDARQIKLQKIAQPGRPDYKIEEDVIGCNHAQVGALLAEHWQLPAKLIETIKFHHFPQLSESPDTALPFLIHLSDYLAAYTFDNDDEENPLEPLHEEVLDLVEISIEELHELSERLHEEYLKAETFMAMAKGIS